MCDRGADDDVGRANVVVAAADDRGRRSVVGVDVRVEYDGGRLLGRRGRRGEGEVFGVFVIGLWGCVQRRIPIRTKNDI